MKRLFVAIDIPTGIKERVEEVQQLFKEQDIFHGRLLRIDHIHITLRFIGDVDRKAEESIEHRLHHVPFHPFSVALGPLGYFGPHGNMITIWLRAKGQELETLASDINKVVHPFVGAAEKPFVGHVSIARVQLDGIDLKRIHHFLQMRQIEPMNFMVTEFVLNQSFITKSGTVHSPLERYKAQQ
jgi:RNA 2',3'-cyclic 3'-phosphodiesterase